MDFTKKKSALQGLKTTLVVINRHRVNVSSGHYNSIGFFFKYPDTEKSSKKSAPKPCKRKSVASSHSELSNMQTKEVKKQSKPQKILVQGHSSPTWQGNLQECLTQSASMVGRTKEEKFTIDVQVNAYIRLRKAYRCLKNLT